MDASCAVVVSSIRRFVIAVALALPACRPPTDFIEPTTTRPPHVDGSVYRSYDTANVEVYETADGCCTIWYATEGEHAVELTGEGLPERVRLVAQAAAQVFAWLDDNGWRRPAPDSLLPPVRDFGLTDNLDIYLLRFVRGDGMWVEESCTQARRPQCTGFLALHHAASDSYPSEQEGVEVLVSHELFHAVQAAYMPDLPRWFSEGTATLIEEMIYPERSDFERLCAHFFEHPGRSLTDPGGGFDGFSYSTALFFQFLARGLPSDYLQRVLARSASGRSVEQAMVLEAGGAHAFADLFARFSALTWLTGGRASGVERARLLAGASDYPEFQLPDLHVDEVLRIEPWASVGVLLPAAGEPRTVVMDGAGHGAGRLVLVHLDAWPEPNVTLAARAGESLEVPAGAEVLAVVANGAPEAVLTARLRLVPGSD